MTWRALRERSEPMLANSVGRFLVCRCHEDRIRLARGGAALLSRKLRHFQRLAQMASTRNLANGSPKAKRPAAPSVPSKILAIDIGGTKVKVLVSGETEPRKLPSGKRLTPAR